MPLKLQSKLAKRIVDGMEAGAELTMSEWAEELSVERGRVSRALTYLRKRGYLFYPLRAEKWGDEGKVVSILRKTSYIKEVMDRHDKNYLNPQLESAFRIIELALPKFPELHGEVKGRLQHFINLLSSETSTVKRLEKEHATR